MGLAFLFQYTRLSDTQQAQIQTMPELKTPMYTAGNLWATITIFSDGKMNYCRQSTWIHSTMQFNTIHVCTGITHNYIHKVSTTMHMHCCGHFVYVNPCWLPAVLQGKMVFFSSRLICVLYVCVCICGTHACNMWNPCICGILLSKEANRIQAATP